MKSDKKKKLIITVIAAIVLFLINNILLGSIVPGMPGGSATGITTMFVITLLSLVLRQVGYIPLLFFIYGLIGLISHLLVGDWLYLFVLLLIVVTSMVYDWLLSLKKYSLKAHIAGFPLFLIMTHCCSLGIAYILNGRETISNIEYYIFIYALILGYLGITMAFICFRIGYSKFNYLNSASL